MPIAPKQIGQEGAVDGQSLVWDAASGEWIPSGAPQSLIPVRKGSAGTISKGEAVYVTGFNVGAGVVEVELADASFSFHEPLGIAAETITDVATGNVMRFGIMKGLDTSPFTLGQPLYVSNGAGGLDNGGSLGPQDYSYPIATVLKDDAADGWLLVQPGVKGEDLPLNTLRDTLSRNNPPSDLNLDGLRSVNFESEIQPSTNTWDTATESLNWTAGNLQNVNISATVTTLTFTDPDIAQSALLRLRITQDATAGHQVTWPAGVSWGAAGAPTLTSTPNGYDIIDFWFVGKSGVETYFAHHWGAGGTTDPDAIHDNVAGEIAAITEKTSNVPADLILIEDSEDSNNKKRMQLGNVTVDAAGRLILHAEKGSAGTISKGQVVYVSGYDVGADFTEVELAEADVAASMPAIGVADSTIEQAADGEVILSGMISGLDTSAFSAGDELWVDTTAGGFTNTRPTGAGTEVQKIAVVARSHPSLGVIEVIGAGRSNDLPNIAEDSYWIGNASGVATAKAIPLISKSITIESPSSSEDISIFFTPRAITISEMRAVLLGSVSPSVTWTIRHATDRSLTGNEVVTGGTTTTSTTTGSDVTTFDDATIPADSFVWIETTAESGVTNELHVTIVFTED